MARIRFHISSPNWVKDYLDYTAFLKKYTKKRGYTYFSKFEVVKDGIVDILYQKRGKYTRPFLHFGTIGLTFFVITFGPYILSQTEEETVAQPSRSVLSVNAFDSSFYTQQAQEVKQYRGGEIISHIVAEGETLSSIAARYGLEVTTILWENNLTEKSPIKPGLELRILPVDGVRHKVARGETIYSIGKKYGLDEAEVQVIVDYPFNEFLNDETFELATGQYLVVPGGIMPEKTVTGTRTTPSRTLRNTPDAGTVTATGSYVWPAAGKITQGYSFYHKAIDIANRSGGAIVAADSGTVAVVGWDSSGYGNRIIIEHGNGSATLYAHLSATQVQAGQRVNRGDLIGQMGSTGRSTGVHLHFEIRQGGVFANPLGFLR